MASGKISREKYIYDSLSNLGLSGNTATVYDVTMAMSSGTRTVISTDYISDLPDSGVLYIFNNGANFKNPWKSLVIFEIAISSSVTLDNKLFFGLVTSSGTTKWYKPTLTEVTFNN